MAAPPGGHPAQAAPRARAAALVEQGAALLRADRLDEAARRFDEAIATDPELPAAHYYAGLVLEQRKHYARAEARYREALALDPRHARAHDRLGFVAGLQGRTEEALSQFEQAVALAPDLFDAHYHLGATRWWTKRPDLAKDPLEATI